MTYFLKISVGTFTKALGFQDLSVTLLQVAVFIPILTMLSLACSCASRKVRRAPEWTGLSNIFWLGTKELRSFFSDVVLLGLVIYAFLFRDLRAGA